MSYIFDGTDDQVQWSLGSCNITGAETFVAVIKLDAGVSWQSYLSLDHPTNGSEKAIGRHSSGNIAAYAGGGANTQTAISHSSADGWMLVAFARASGANIPEMTKYPFGGSPTHTAAGATMNNSASIAGGKVVFGQIDGSDWFKGRLAVTAVFASALSQANRASLVDTFTRANWLSLTPAGLWDATDQFATDQTGNGADRTSITGTTSSADDPTGWASWAGAAATPIPSLVMAPLIPA